LLFYAPWIYGMATWSQQMLLIPWLTSIISLTWLSTLFDPRLRLPLNPLFFSLVCLVIFAVIQVTPLSNWIYQSLAPSAAFESSAVSLAAEYLSIDAKSPELLAASAESGPLFKTLSIHPVQTRASIVGLVSGVAMLFCCGILFQDKAGRLLLLVSVCLISTAVSLLGILQNISWNQWTLLQMPSNSGFATFVSRNSAPQYLAVGIGSTIACWIAWLNNKRQKERTGRRYRPETALARVRRAIEDILKDIDPLFILLLVCLVLLVAGVVAASSRGGFVALFFALTVTLMLTLGRNQKLLVPGLVGFTAIALILLFFLSAFELDDEIARRLEVEKLESPARFEFWKLAISQPKLWLFGGGLGCFHFAIMPADTQFRSWIYHAESVYVEMIAEFGWLIAGIGIAGFCWLVYQLLLASQSRHRITWPAVLFASLAIGLQSTVDFSLIIPSIFLTLAAIVGTYLGEFTYEKQKSPPSSRTTRTPWLVGGISACMLGLIWQGTVPLRGFAQGERLNKSLQSGMSEIPNVSLADGETLDLAHPEVLLQLARIKVNAIEAYVRQLTFWKEEDLPLPLDRLTRLEFLTALLRSEDEKSWGNFVELIRADSKVENSISAANTGFATMSGYCVYDWRGHWGSFQTTLESDPIKHALRCARLRNLTISMPRLQQSVASCSLIAGERVIGLDFWKTTLAHHPKQTYRIANLAEIWLDADDLKQVLPNSAIAKTILIRSLSQRADQTSIVEQLASNLDINDLQSEAQTVDEWDLVVWLASFQGRNDEFIAGLRTLSAMRPMDKSVRVKLAKALESTGEIEEAIAQLEQASRRSLLNASEEAYLIQLREKRPKRGGVENSD
jgi:tetratricopeptide (TPR) repeat protein